MKNIYILLIVTGFLGCEKDVSLTFSSKKINSETCNNCPAIDIDVPQAIPENKVSTKINDHITGFAINILNYSEDHAVKNIEEGIKVFNSDFKSLNNNFSDSMIAWEASIQGKVSFINDEIASLKFEHYLFTGGAHGYGGNSFLNFNVNNGDKIKNEELFKDYKKFRDFAEKKFRVQENIPEGESINSTGFLFEDDIFILPANIGFTNEGIELIYNPYEINVYSEGNVILKIPFEEVNEFLAIK
ncbi:DUF3298 and DUF4163 domain-containing protein [Abyssalbus ytuae]|uniref:DUF3298 and DUF4163 domain-containing protein n=1 Tax=Abyssalbus ytuae TaxID=2926907 RepID=A0A9E6ZNF7_9FLAO|nr:DUF3298 and DUF4163 domain-containing protein [Abyssalbus ytuae]UOB19154.1 DUF3298 and DUF4163 domain-containing protein [Abyssalbus ytuae]